MSEWKSKRFWTTVDVEEHEDGYAVTLDKRLVKTPAKVTLKTPTRALAEALAKEWDAQEDVVRPASMPFTRMANSAIDKVVPQQGGVCSEVAGFGGSDLICYRADAPEGLVAVQAKAWDPLVDWSATALSAPLRITSGVIPVAQPEESLVALAARVEAATAFELAALHDLTSLSGSLVIGLAAAEGWGDPDDLWSRSRTDELWQIAQWGPDEEAEATAELKRQAFLHAFEFYRLSQNA